MVQKTHIYIHILNYLVRQERAIESTNMFRVCLFEALILADWLWGFFPMYVWT